MAWTWHKVIILRENRGQTRIINNLYSRPGNRELNIPRHTITSELHLYSPPPFASVFLDCCTVFQCAVGQKSSLMVRKNTQGWGTFFWYSNGIDPLLVCVFCLFVLNIDIYIHTVFLRHIGDYLGGLLLCFGHHQGFCRFHSCIWK